MLLLPRMSVKIVEASFHLHSAREVLNMCCDPDRSKAWSQSLTRRDHEEQDEGDHKEPPHVLYLPPPAIMLCQLANSASVPDDYKNIVSIGQYTLS